jgi:hypothetical protein
MWRKFMDDSPTHASASSGITMAEVFSPMLEPTSLEATISECSLEAKPSDIFTRKLKERFLSCCKSLITNNLLLAIRYQIDFLAFLFFSRLHYVTYVYSNTYFRPCFGISPADVE